VLPDLDFRSGQLPPEWNLREYPERANFEIVWCLQGDTLRYPEGEGKHPEERKRVMAIARDPLMDAVLVTEPARA
jgi:hypothetical protein